MDVSFAKLKNGGWGLRIKVGKGESVAVGDRVTVTRRDGSTESAVVGPVVWSGDDDSGTGKVALTKIQRETSIAG